MKFASFWRISIVGPWKFNFAVPAAAALLCLGGCGGEETPRATLEPATVQGSSFDEPVVTPAAPQVAAAEGSAGPAADAATSAAPVVAATAEDVPADIAQIPSATPVARYDVATTPVPAAPEVASAQPDSAAPGDYKPISFNILSGFKYTEPIPSVGEKPEEVEKRRESNQIPADVVALNGKKAVVEGWMVPMEVLDDGSVKSFVLVKTQPQCCFGDTQSMNEWVDVNMGTGKKAEFNVDVPVRVYGELEVGEKVEDGFVLSIYRMKADRVGS